MADFVPEGLNDNRQGLKPLFQNTHKWRAVRYAANRTAPLTAKARGRVKSSRQPHLAPFVAYLRHAKWG
jgi:hypothetical protein